MFGPSTMGIGAGPLYTNALMGQAPSAAERETARKASSSILRRDCIQIEESENRSRPESWSLNFDCTSQAPYSTKEDDEMMTQSSLLYLPPENPSHDLAFFLRTTGPISPHRRPSKLEHPQQAASGPKNALRFLRLRHKRLQPPPLRDEGGLLGGTEEAPFRKRAKQRASSEAVSTPMNPSTPTVKQKVSSEGTKYLALQSTQDTDQPGILESQVSISVVDDDFSSEAVSEWRAERKGKLMRRPPTPGAKLTYSSTCNDGPDVVAHACPISRPCRADSSISPTPEPQSAVSMSESYQSEVPEAFCQRSFDWRYGLSNHPAGTRTSASLPLPDVSIPNEQPASCCAIERSNLEIEHPSPRRLASHPLLLQRASSITPFLSPRSISDSPGPPPKNPLRLRREARNIEDMLTTDLERKATPRIAPSIMAVSDYNAEVQLIKPTVVTECVGPIKRPRSREKSSRPNTSFLASRKEREERIRARKLRDRSIAAKTIDALVNAPPSTSRHRLKKARPNIQIPEPCSDNLVTRASSPASSNASWRKVTDTVRGEDVLNNGGGHEHMPISPTASNVSGMENITLSSVMLVAEEIPDQKVKLPRKPPKLATKEGKAYAPRPRSASVPRNGIQRRSRQAVRTPTRPSTPETQRPDEDAPPLPSLPPTRALPAPPPALGSRKSNKDMQLNPMIPNGELPFSSLREIAPNITASDPGRRLPHVATQTQRRRLLPKDSNIGSEIHARLEALEKHNALLSAALTAVLRTNGALNSAVPAEVENLRSPMVWENRIARRSAASQGGSSSNGSALEMYMNTRRGSKNGH